MHQLQRSWVRSQHPSAQWNLRGGRRSNVDYGTKKKSPKKHLKKGYLSAVLDPSSPQVHGVHTRLQIQAPALHLKYSSRFTVPCFTLTSSVADPGCLSRILIFTHPGSRIQKICCHTFFVASKFHKIFNYFMFELLKEKMWACGRRRHQRRHFISSSVISCSI